MSDYKFKTHSLSKSYNSAMQKLEVLKGINLTVERDEFIAIQGPSGAGKSTLLHILGGLDNPTEGEVLFEGLRIQDLNDAQKADFRNKRIGFVFQFYHLLPELSVLENVMLPGLFKSWKEKRAVRGYAQNLLNNLGLAARLYHLPSQLSGGEQQRAAIARALINRPDTLLCDEPTGNLDSDNGVKILCLLNKLNKEEKMTVVMVTHDKDIASCADRVIYLKDGVLLN